MCQQLKYFKCRYTVLLKSKLPVATPFLCDKNHVSCYTLLVAHYKNRIVQTVLHSIFIQSLLHTQYFHPQQYLTSTMAPGWEFDSAVTFERGENLRMSDERWKIKICIGWVPDFLSCISWIPQAKLSWIPDSLTWGGSFPHTHQTE